MNNYEIEWWIWKGQQDEIARLRAGYSDLAYIFKRAGMTDAYNTVVNLMQHRGIALQETGDVGTCQDEPALCNLCHGGPCRSKHRETGDD